jgi:hypothetical protein
MLNNFIRRSLPHACSGYSRSFHASSVQQAKIVMALYPDPKSGFPPQYARESKDVPVIKGYADGQTTPSPVAEPPFQRGDLLGCVSGTV